MTIKYIISLFLCLTLSFMGLKAQSYYVYFADGNALRINGDQKEAILKGMVINDQYSVECMGNCQLVLIDENGRNIKIGNSNLYTYQNIKEEFEGASKDDIMSSYFSYVWKKLLDKKIKPDKKEMKAVGAVARASDELMISPMDSAVILGKTVNFQWETSTPPYELTIYDAQDLEVLSVQLNDTTLLISSTTPLFKTDQVFYWNVADSDPLISSSIKNVFFLPKGELKNKIIAYVEYLKKMPITSENEKQRLFLYLFKEGN